MFVSRDSREIMLRFDDYHRTVVGYHGTGLTAALRIVNRIEGFRRSQKDYDWLGRGIYFWEHAPRQALRFARLRQEQYRRKKAKTPEDVRRATEPLAVVACMIRLGFCFDLLEPENIEYIRGSFLEYQQSVELTGATLPRNTRKYRKLDCAVFEYAYKVISKTELVSPVDTVRGVYVPAGGERRVWSGSWIARDTHIQLCVRNPASLLGTWLHTPDHLEVADVCEAIQAPVAAIGPPDRPGSKVDEDDALDEEAGTDA